MRTCSMVGWLVVVLVLGTGCPPAGQPDGGSGGGTAGGSSGGSGGGSGGGGGGGGGSGGGGGQSSDGGTLGFTISVVPGSTSVARDGAQTVEVRIGADPTLSGALSLAVSGLPSGVQAAFGAPMLMLPDETATTLTLTASASAALVSQTLTLTATGAGETHQAPLVLTVFDSAAPGFDVSLRSSNVVLLPDGIREVVAVIRPRGGFTGDVALSATGLPPGVTAQFNPPMITLGTEPLGTRLTLTATPTAPPTSVAAVVVVTGTAASATGSAGLSLQVAPAGDPVATRQAVIAAIQARSEELASQGVKGLAFAQGVGATMATYSEYAATGVDVDTQSAWGRFQDGVLHVVVDNRAPEPSPVNPRPVPRKGATFPGAAQARLLHSFGSNFEGQTPIDLMRTYLTDKKWVVKPGVEGEAVVGTLRGVRGDGFFYFNTHGGRIEVDDPSIPDGKMYSIQSSTLVDADYDKVFADDLSHQRLVEFTARNGDVKKIGGISTGIPDFDTRYGITFRFVDKYMSFQSNSVVWLNACYSSRNADFVNAFIRKGAGVVLGWSELLSAGAAYASAPYFVDRMLGENQHTPVESPPQRPFPYDAVLTDMGKKSLDKDPSTGGSLVATVKPGLVAPPIFAPSIAWVETDEYRDVLHLHGAFGEQLGTVQVAGVSLAGCQWAVDHVSCTLPQSGAGSAGDVIATVQNVKSNARQLTEWSTTFDYTWQNFLADMGEQMAGSGTLRLRADLGRYRTQAGEAPQYELRVGVATKNSTLTVTASGAWSDGTCSNSLSGMGVFPSSAAMPPNLLLANAFQFHGQTLQGALGLGFGATTPPFTYTVSGPSGCGAGTYPIASAFGLLDGETNFMFTDPTSGAQHTLPLPGLNLTLNSSFGLNERVYTTSDLGGTLTVTIHATAAQFPPREAVDSGR